MTPDDIIRMARNAGIKLPDGAFPARGSFNVPELLDFARRAHEAGAAAEREAYAAKLQSLRAQAYGDGHKAGKQAEREACAKVVEAAAAIRARGPQ